MNFFNKTNKLTKGILLFNLIFSQHILAETSANEDKTIEINVKRIAQKKTGLCWAASSLLTLESEIVTHSYPESILFSLGYVQYLKWKHLVEMYRNGVQQYPIENPSEFVFTEGGGNLDLYGLMKKNHYTLQLESPQERANPTLVENLSDISLEDQHQVRQLVDDCQSKGLTNSEIVAEIYKKFGITQSNIDELIKKFESPENKMAITNPNSVIHTLKTYTYSFDESTPCIEGRVIKSSDEDSHLSKLGSEYENQICSKDKILLLIKQEIEKGRVVTVSTVNKDYGHSVVVSGVVIKDGKVIKLKTINSANVSKPEVIETVTKFLKNVSTISISVQE